MTLGKRQNLFYEMFHRNIFIVKCFKPASFSLTRHASNERSAAEGSVFVYRFAIEYNNTKIQ